MSSKLRAISRDSVAEPSDVELLRGIAAGEPWAARATWDKFHPAVHGLLRRGLGTADVEDATQEVFYRFFNRVSSIVDPDALRSFIFSIAVRVLRWQLRRRWVRRVLQFSDRPPEPLVLPADAEAKKALVRLYQKLDELGGADRSLFLLRRIEELSVKEIADILGVSLATAKRRVSRACARMDRIALRDPLLAGYLRAFDQQGQQEGSQP